MTDMTDQHTFELKRNLKTRLKIWKKFEMETSRNKSVIYENCIGRDVEKMEMYLDHYYYYSVIYQHARFSILEQCVPLYNFECNNINNWDHSTQIK